MKQSEQLVDLGPRFQMFSKQVRRVGLPGDLQQLEFAPTQTLLHPQGVALQVAQFPQPLSSSYSKRG